MTWLGRGVREALSACIVAVLLALLLRTFVLQVYRVPSVSMEPTLRAGDLLVVNKFVLRRGGDRWNPWLPQRPVDRGDVLVFPNPTAPGDLLVKRCVARDGDHVQIRDKELLLEREAVIEDRARRVDERIYPDSAFLPKPLRTRDQFGPIVVPHQELLCLGDNRDHSLDSRHWGTIEERRVVGLAVVGVRRSPPDVEGGAAPHVFRIR